MHRLLQLPAQQPRIQRPANAHELALRTEHLDLGHARPRAESVITRTRLDVAGLGAHLRDQLDPADALDEQVCAVDREGQVVCFLLAVRAARHGAGAALGDVPLELEGAGAGHVLLCGVGSG